MRLRTYRLDAAREAVLRAGKFRKPQRASFEAVHRLVREFDADLPCLEPTRLRDQLREVGLNVSTLPPNLIFDGNRRRKDAAHGGINRLSLSRRAVAPCCCARL
jgi:hypothetical protein